MSWQTGRVCAPSGFVRRWLFSSSNFCSPSLKGSCSLVSGVPVSYRIGGSSGSVLVPVSRSVGQFRFSLPACATTRLDQTRIPGGTFPVPPEQKFTWKNRTAAYGGYIQQSISFYQMKTMWPYMHQTAMRNWCRLFQLWNWIGVPLIVLYIMVKNIDYDVRKFTEHMYWY